MRVVLMRTQAETSRLLFVAEWNLEDEASAAVVVGVDCSEWLLVVFASSSSMMLFVDAIT